MLLDWLVTFLGGKKGGFKKNAWNNVLVCGQNTPWLRVMVHLCITKSYQH